jgi:hypothetical protein
VTLDVLCTTAVDQDIYQTDSNVDVVNKRLEEGKFGLYIIGERAAERIGSEMAAKIIEAVGAGSGLIVCPNKKLLHFEKALKSAKLELLAPGHTLRKGFPLGLFSKQQSWDKNVFDLMKSGKIGKGRVVGYPSYRMRPRMDKTEYRAIDFPLSDFLDPWVARVIYWASGIGSENVSGKIVPLKKGHNLGKVISSYLVVDNDGRTLDYGADIADKVGPQLFVKSVTDSVKGDSPFVFDVALSNAPNGSVKWSLEDFSGRVIETGSGSGIVKVPTRALYTNLGIFRAELILDGKVVDTARVNAYARDRDTLRTYNDYTASIWPMGDNVHPDTIHEADKVLIDIGFRASLLPVGRSCANTLAGGLALGGGFLGGGDVFCGWPHKDNVRTTGEINTAKGREMLAKRAQAEAAKTAKYGVTQCVVCDEPNMSMRHCEMEPDEQPENIAEYRLRMKSKYKTIDLYNKRHETSYSNWSEIGPAHLKDARASGKYAEFLEWRSFNVDRWCEVIKLLSDNGKKVDPDLKLALYNSFGQTALSGNDYWKLLTRAGLEFSNEYTAMVYFGRDAIYNFDEFYRSFRPDLRVWGFTGYQLSKDQISFMPWWFAAHRYGGFTWFATWSWQWNILDIPTCSLNGDSVALKDALRNSRLLDGLGKYTLLWDWTPREVALYYSHESLMVSTLLGKETKSFQIDKEGPLHEYMYSRQGLQYLVESLLYQHDFVAPEQVESGKLDAGYKIVFLPRILALSDSEVKALKRFAANGGTIVADVMPGDYDELGVKRSKNPFTSEEVKIWGRSFNDFDLKQHAEMLAVLKSSGARPVLYSKGIESIEGREAVRLTDGVGNLYMILRMTGRSSDEAEQTFQFPEKAHTWDVRTHKYLGKVDSVTTKVGLSSASVFVQLPFKLEKMRVSAPKTVNRGADAEFAFALDVPKNAKNSRFVYNFKLTKPDGTSSFLFERNIDAPFGKASLKFRIASNDPVGIWKATVIEPLTGLTKECAFEVR